VPVPAITGCTCHRLRQLTRRLTKRYDASLAPVGLRVTQYSLLATLCRNGPATMSRLATLMEMDRTTLTRDLKPLGDAGLVNVAAGEDARERIVSATGRGRRTWRAARDSWRRAQDEVQRVLGVDRVAALHELLDASLGRLRATRHAGPPTPRNERRRRK
jgi:DNA-binding MarR family transcriptional regulator